MTKTKTKLMIPVKINTTFTLIVTERCSLCIFQQCAARSGASQVKDIKHLKENRLEHSDTFAAASSSESTSLFDTGVSKR